MNNLLFSQRFQCELGWNKVKYARITITHVCFIALTLAGSRGCCLNTRPIGNFHGNRSVPSNLMSDIEYSVITSDAIKSFDCRNNFNTTDMQVTSLLNLLTIFNQC